MRVLVAGATEAIGRQLVPRLVAASHEVTGITRSESKQALLYELSAGRPMQVPRLIARLLAGEAGAMLMTDARRAWNAKAKRELYWASGHPSWRQGFRPRPLPPAITAGVRS